MKSRTLALCCCILIVTGCSTIENAHRTYPTASWSSSDPLSIPYRARLEQFEKGNLVPNPSFEDGGIPSDGSADAQVPAGWEIVGPHVSWIEEEAESDAGKEVYDGRRSVRITRKTASEMDEAEGIISDYIPVIPGNYDFTYHIRLRNIASNRYRLGVRLFDAIVVKLLFFDENKQPVDAGYLNPLSGGTIDNSDKGYSFSNYWRIDDFPWGMVRGRSYNYPFSEGDVPDSTRYVRLFFGLKGTGTLWLDDIHYGYSKWNFTALERFTPYFDKRLTFAESIIPTPKQIREMGEIVYYNAENPQSRPPVIVLPENPAPAERSAARILQKKIGAIMDDSGTGAIVTGDDVPFSDLSDAKLILSIGRNKLYRNLQPELPLESIRSKSQGYVIQSQRIDGSQVVFLVGQSPIGSYNAAATALQLFDTDAFIYHDATVVDYPDFLGRSYVFKNWKNRKELHNDLTAVERMSLYKLNKVYVGHNREEKNWYHPGTLYREGLAEAGWIFRESGVMSLAQMVNPYSHFAMEASAENLDDRLRYTWTHSSPESLAMLKDVFKIGLEAGADTIMLLADDFVPHTGVNRQNYSLYTDEDKERFVNLQNAQAYTINHLKKWIDRDYPGTHLEFCPPWYSNEHIDRSESKAEWYFKDLIFQIPGDVAVIWTGPTIRSLSIDMADLHRFRSLISRWPMIWDNTLYARNIETKRYGGYATYYPGKVRMCNLFEPYDTYKPEAFEKFNDKRQMYTNGSAYSEAYKIKYATVADYQWNTAAYDPERSLWKVLYRTYGPACARELIRFNDAYYQIYGVCMQMEREGVTNRLVEKGNKALADLNDRFMDVSGTLPGKSRLLKELETFQDRQRTRFEKLSRQEEPTGS